MYKKASSLVSIMFDLPCYTIVQGKSRCFFFQSYIKVKLTKCLKNKLLRTIRVLRPSDSLNEGLLIKMIREKFQRKRYFFYEKDSRFNPRLILKGSFLIGQVPLEKYGLKTLFYYSTYRK